VGDERRPTRTSGGTRTLRDSAATNTKSVNRSSLALESWSSLKAPSRASAVAARARKARYAMMACIRACSAKPRASAAGAAFGLLAHLEGGHGARSWAPLLGFNTSTGPRVQRDAQRVPNDDQISRSRNWGALHATSTQKRQDDHDWNRRASPFCIRAGPHRWLLGGACPSNDF